jgi:hypothetical protein
VGCAADLIDAGTGWTVSPLDASTLARVMKAALERAASLPRSALAGKTMEGSYAAGAAQLLDAIGEVRAGRKRCSASPTLGAPTNEQRA